jgi:hypothetical protein
MSTDPGAQDRAVPPEAASDFSGNADAPPVAFLEQIYEEAMARLAVITDQWQTARDALRGG